MNYVGLVILAALWVWISIRFSRSPKEGRWTWYGPVGLGLILVSELLLWRKMHFVELYFTPLVWTGYILLVDSCVFRLKGQSRIKDSVGKFLWLAFWSIPLWLIFEAYNVHLRNWAYLNLPQDLVERYIGYGWAFATIWPGLFETTDLIATLFFRRHTEQGLLRRPSSTLLGWSVGVGSFMLVVPIMLPQAVAGYLFGFVWLGMIFFLDPINLWLKKRSLWQEWVSGYRAQIYAMLYAGVVCGFLWEFWNYWAIARWVYVFPIMQGFKIFEMPLPGYLGFPPFCIEAFVMFEFVNFIRNPSRTQ